MKILFACAQNLTEVIQHLKIDLLAHILSWFSLKDMVTNRLKFQAMFLYVIESISIEIGNYSLKSSKEVEPLGVIIDNKSSSSSSSS